VVQPTEDIEKKSVIHRKYPFFATSDKDKPIGFAALKIHKNIPPIFLVWAYWSNIISKESAIAYWKPSRDIVWIMVIFCLAIKTLDASA
jgi:hypothetical protein